MTQKRKSLSSIGAIASTGGPNESPSQAPEQADFGFYEGPVGVLVKRLVGPPGQASSHASQTGGHVQHHSEHLHFDREKFHQFWDTFNAIFVRVVFIAISLTFLFFVYCVRDSFVYLLMLGLSLVIIVDGIYVVVKRRGRDYYWCSITFFVYASINCAYIIIMLNFKYKVLDIACLTNSTNLALFDSCGSIPMTICKLDELMVSIFMISMVMGRFFLPASKRMPEEIQFEQVMSFMAAAADVVDFSNYIQEDDLATEYTLIQAMQVIFVCNVLQFCFSLKATKKRNYELRGVRKWLDIIFSTECWAFILICFTQDIPCFIVRVYIWSAFDSTAADLYFFTVRNFMMILLMTFRFVKIFRTELRKTNKIQPIETAEPEQHEAVRS